MRILNGVLSIIMILFAAVQYNDPDGIFWAAIYGIGAAWCAAAALRPGLLAAAGPARALYWLSLAAAVIGVAWFWPHTPGWWRQDVWWRTETAREGMGVMILFAAIAIAGLTARRRRPG